MYHSVTLQYSNLTYASISSCRVSPTKLAINIVVSAARVTEKSVQDKVDKYCFWS